MLDSNTNKVTWIGVAVGIVALLGVGASQLYPDAFESAKSQIVKVTTGFADNNDKATSKTRLAAVPNITDDYATSKFNYRNFNDTNKTVDLYGAKDRTNIDKNLVIPASVVKNGVAYNVVSVGGFDNFSFNTVKIELDSVSIPSSVKSIGSSAFNNSRLKSVSLSEGLETIGNSAFYNGDGVAKADGFAGISDTVIPNSVTMIGESSFQGNHLKSLDLGTGVSEIKSNAFDSHMLDELEIPKSVKTVDYAAFQTFAGKGVGLTSLQLHDGLETIGMMAFYGNRLQEVQIPKTVKTVGSGAFSFQRDSKFNNMLTKVVVGSHTTFAHDSFPLEDSVIIRD